MAIIVRPLDPPTIFVNGEEVKQKEIQHSALVFEGNRDAGLDLNTVPSFSPPAEITFTGPTDATIRYTFNSKKVNLSSKKFIESNPPSVRNGGNGFDGTVLTIRAKAYRSGQSSKTAEACIRIANTGVAGSSKPEEPNTTQTYRGDVDSVLSQTGK
jgi:hypothetical protein